MSTAEMRKIPMLDLKAQYRNLAEETESAVKRVLESQQLILGPEVKDLEREIAAYCQCEYAVGCASGSDALLLALMAFDVGPGDEVITTPFTFFATAGSIIRLGAKPVFVDIDPQSFNMNVATLASAVTARTKAIMPVHLFGQCVEMESVEQVARRTGAAIIEDAAQAIGAEYYGRRAGSLGDVAAFSFYPSKNLGGAGDGGMLTTNRSEVAEELRMLRAHGAKRKYYHDRVGVNSRLDSLQAAILRVKFRYLDDWAAARQANARRYDDLFDEAGLRENGQVTVPSVGAGQHHVFNQYVIRVEKRDDLRAYLNGCGVGTEIYYPVPMHLQTCFADLGYAKGDFIEAEKAADEALAIPIYPELTEDDQAYVVSTIARFYNG
ncbi:MAG TPA: DegT/DnrJ/EryC1/StrS family aminotransferase [Blastocatellia bacterium]|nr:DegT/DnrJ/EryC1/StrS family aminotransferase [Blastocatellia bacterium]